MDGNKKESGYLIPEMWATETLAILEESIAANNLLGRTNARQRLINNWRRRAKELVKCRQEAKNKRNSFLDNIDREVEIRTLRKCANALKKLK